METGVLDDWNERVDHDENIVPCEIELWFRQNPITRKAAIARVTHLVEELNGQVICNSIIEEIAYQALLVKLPIAAVKNVLLNSGSDIALLQCEQIQFFRAVGQMATIIPEGDRITDMTMVESELPTGEPIVALFDGLTLQHHSRLAGRLIVDDPDGFEADYQAQERCHGTAMASLILHGELDADEKALPKPLYVRPILKPDPRDWVNNPRKETAPTDLLIVDLIHRAVRRLYEGEGTEPPVAPSICVTNFSVGIRDRLFDSSLSPLAKLLDWLAWRYKILFVVSTGNHSHEIKLNISQEDFNTLDQSTIQAEVLKAIAADTRHRRLLSPAEATNVLTIGSLHSDNSGENKVPHAIDPYIDPNLPSPINAQGMGYRRGIKPELLAPGGRVVLQEAHGSNSHAVFNLYDGILPPGQRVAAPGSTFGDISASWYTRGTSNATALTSRAAAKLYDVLEELRDEPGGELIDMVPPAVWLKALLVHAADWGSAGELFDRILRTKENSRKFREYVTRLLGYGTINISQVSECTIHRVTALGGGLLRADEAHIHRFPLPPSLSGQRGWRRLTITLAWLTPINPFHQAWQRADLWFAPPKETLNIDRMQADYRAVQRGTVQHEVLEGGRAVAFVDGDNLDIQVNCRSEAGALEEEIPYALAVSLEVGQDIGITIYDEIRVRVQAAKVRVTPAT